MLGVDLLPVVLMAGFSLQAPLPVSEESAPAVSAEPAPTSEASATGTSNASDGVAPDASASESETSEASSSEEATALEEAPSGGAALAEPSDPSGSPSDAPVESSTSAVDSPTAKAPTPRHTWVYKNLFAARYNPIGLVNEFSTGWRMQLFTKPGALYADSFVAAKLHTFLTPAYVRIGPRLEIQPLAVLNLSATYDYSRYLGTFDQIQSFDTATAVHSDSELARLADAGGNYTTGGHLVTLAALFQAKVSKFAMRDNLRFYYIDFDLRDGETSYYDQTLDMLTPNKGWSLTNDLDALFLTDFGLKIGARYTLTHAFYQQKHFLPGEPISKPNGPTHRIGPALLHTFYDKPERRFNKPTLIVLTQWWARHRWRTGADTSAALPYIVLGFLFEGQLLPRPS